MFTSRREMRNGIPLSVSFLIQHRNSLVQLDLTSRVTLSGSDTDTMSRLHSRSTTAHNFFIFRRYIAPNIDYKLRKFHQNRVRNAWSRALRLKCLQTYSAGRVEYPSLLVSFSK